MPTVFIGQTDSTVNVPVSELRFFVGEHYQKLGLQKDTFLLKQKCNEYQKQISMFVEEIKNQKQISSEKGNQINLLTTTLDDTDKKLTHQQKVNSRIKKVLITAIIASFLGGGVLGFQAHR